MPVGYIYATMQKRKSACPIAPDHLTKKRARPVGVSSLVTNQTRVTEISPLGADVTGEILTYLTDYGPLIRVVCKSWFNLVLGDGKEDVANTDQRFYVTLAREGNLKVLAWAKANYRPPDGVTVDKAIRAAVDARRLDIVMCFDSETTVDDRIERMFSREQSMITAAVSGDLDIVQYLDKRGYPMDVVLRQDDICIVTAVAQQLHVLDWLVAIHPQCRDRVCKRMVAMGRLDTLEVLINAGYPYSL